MSDNTEGARAARRSARSEPVVVSLGAEEFRFLPEMPLDVVLALDTLDSVSAAEARAWVEAHILVDAKCDTSCADDGLPLLARACDDELEFRRRLKKARHSDGSRVSGDEFHAFHEAILKAYAVTEGESQSSGGSPATPGESSSGTASGSTST